MKTKSRFGLLFASAAAVAGVMAPGFVSAAPGGNGYETVLLVSNHPGVAATYDPDLVNAWGISHGPGTPLWVSDNGTNKTTLYDRHNGSKIPLTVKITHGGAPTGQVWVQRGRDSDSDIDFPLHEKGKTGPSVFLFATEAGAIEGWNPNVDLNRALVAVDRSAQGAVYKGIAIAQDTETIYAADFANNLVEMFDHRFKQIGSFTDPGLPPRFAPFNVAHLNGKLYVAFAKREAGGTDEVDKAGLGYVDVFSKTGQLMQHLVSNGPLNAPWGMTIAPKNFGQFSGALLVGNFGDGKIHALDPGTGALLGTLRHPDGKPIRIDGLWGIDSGPDARVTFAAGPNDEADGLLGQIRVAGP
ncbi:MAG TPA: TIGR03118 family protein [Rhizomicrobium sp.]|jgi:uncharacterized protein (TIGR03118 family)